MNPLNITVVLFLSVCPLLGLVGALILVFFD